MSLRISVLVLALLAASCGDQDITFVLDPSAKGELERLPGAIRIGVSDGGEQKKIEIRSGTIKPLAEPIGATKESRGSSSSGGATMLPDRPDVEYKGPYVFSPTRRYVAAAVIDSGSQLFYSSAFSVVDVSDKKVIATIKGDTKEAVSALAWSPDSEAIAVLRTIEYPSGFSIRSVISSMSGHPMRSETYFLEIYDRSGQRRARAKLAERVPQSLAEMAWVN